MVRTFLNCRIVFALVNAV